MFKHSKIYRMHTTPQNIGEDLNETTPDFLGWGSRGLQESYPLMTFNSIEDVLNKTEFAWHESVSSLIKDTTIELIDENTFKITAVYDNEESWEEFNNICKRDDISHGWRTFKTGIFYDLNK